MWLRIESFQNRRVKEAIALRKSDERRRTGRIIIDGVREIERGWEAGLTVEELFFCPSIASEKAKKLVEKLAQNTVTILEVPQRLFEKMAFGERLEGVVAVARAPVRMLHDLVFAELPEPPLVLIAEGIEKPGNLGAMVRTADGAGASAVIAADTRCDLYSPQAIRASLGIIFAMPVIAAESVKVLQFLRTHSITCVAATVDGSLPYFEVDFTAPTAIVLGSEAGGLSEIWRQEAEKTVRIPMLGRADSLNVSVAAAVLLYEARRQRTVTKPRNRP